MSLADYKAGHSFERHALEISAEFTERYRAAVAGIASDEHVEEGERVPPMALAAAALGKLIAELGLGAGTIHAGQEVEFIRPVKVGERMYAVAEIASNAVRRSSRFTTIRTEIRDVDGHAVATAVSSVIVPEPAGAGAQSAGSGERVSGN